ncbi:MAG: hypothetical protein JWQ88_210 [Rhodoferax sp.]|nr:hypothetical protein [Rhodoferax sp.]
MIKGLIGALAAHFSDGCMQQPEELVEFSLAALGMPVDACETQPKKNPHQFEQIEVGAGIQHEMTDDPEDIDAAVGIAVKPNSQSMSRPQW